MDWFRRSFVMLFIVTLAGCSGPLNSALWKASSYQETIRGFYLNPKDRVMLISGEKYNYVIQCDSQLCNAAQASRHLEMKTTFGELSLMPNGVVYGEVTFSPAGGDVPPSDPVWVRRYMDMGLLYKKNGYHWKKQTFSFQAKPYVMEGVLPFEVLQYPLTTTVRVADPMIETVGKMVVTPAAVILDGVIVFAAVSFFLIVVTTNGGLVIH
ncbi:hypothetical protein [Photobacterium sp. 1_MG-2023]|uniref:hypothetical protein n=1 Tax=Photobacterium sp. 1_MG-2023 TaxID=3062646 RepID=UPI0026E16F73|nr:hypothetical protein [Photobacterium sp. 1_MG-2023]MDO6708595.1 hypothetical protein [Photobacterium sp. 1_MG-2023]